jgi:hypothetical protein
MFGKLKDGVIEYATSIIIFDDGSCICNPKKEQLIELGYKEVVNSDYPALNENEYTIELYEETETLIIISYSINDGGTI